MWLRTTPDSFYHTVTTSTSTSTSPTAAPRSHRSLSEASTLSDSASIASSPRSVRSTSPSIETLVSGRLDMNHRATPYKPLASSHFDGLKRRTVIETTGERGRWCERHGLLVWPGDRECAGTNPTTEERCVSGRGLGVTSAVTGPSYRVSKWRRPRRMKVRVLVDCDHCVQMLGRREWVYEADVCQRSGCTGSPAPES